MYKVECNHAGLVNIPEDNSILTLCTAASALRHIPADAIRALICYNVITGLQLLDNKRPIFCEFCEYAKVTCKCISKEQITLAAKAFGDKIHSDL